MIRKEERAVWLLLALHRTPDVDALVEELLIAAGAHAKLVQQRLGRASITTTLNVYGRVLPTSESALVTQLDTIYDGAATTEPDGTVVPLQAAEG